MAFRQSFSGASYADVQQWQALSRPGAGAGFSSRLAQLAYGFAWSLVIAAGVGGLGLSLYRNDVLLNLARDSGKESRYLEWERQMLGAPGWGTPRSVQSAESAGAAVPVASTAELPSSAPNRPAPEQNAPEPSSPGPGSAPSVAAAATEPAELTEKKNLGSRPTTEKKSLGSAEADAGSITRATRQTRSTASSSRSTASAATPEPRAASRKAQPSRADDDDDGEPVAIEIVDPGSRKADRTESAPEPRKAAVAKKEAPAESAAKAPAKKVAAAPPAGDDDNPLKAAIRSAILQDQSGN